jgi:hypothetical protein
MLHPPLWSANVSVPAAGDRRLITRMFRATGVIDKAAGHLAVTQRATGANMSVDVAVGACVIPGTDVANQGSVFCDSDAVVNVAVNAAPGAGTSRIDRIYAKWNDADVLGGTSSWTISYAAGTAAGSPSAPALPASSIPLAQFTIVSGETTIETGQITDQRTQAVLAAGTIVAEYTTPSQSVGNNVVADKTLGSPTIRPAGAATAAMFFNAGTNTRMLCPFTGIYDVHWNAQSSGPGGYGWKPQLQKNAGTGAADNVVNLDLSASQAQLTVVAVGIYMQAGEYFRFRVQNLTGASRNFDSSAAGLPRLIYRGPA